MKFARVSRLSGVRTTMGRPSVSPAIGSPARWLYASSPPASASPSRACPEEHLERGIRVDRGARGSGELGEQADPRGEFARTVVAVHHRHGIARRGRDQVEFVVCVRERMLQHHHREDARACADVAGARDDRVGGDHAGTGVALGRAERDSWPKGARGVEQGGALGGQLARMPTGGEHLGEQVGHVQPRRSAGHESIERREQPCVVVVRRGVDREHARRVTDTEHPATRELPMHVTGERGDEADVPYVRLLVEDRLVQVGDRPSQRDVQAELVAELGGGRARRRIAPRARSTAIRS